MQYLCPMFLSFNKEEIEDKIVSICDYLNLNKNFNDFLNWILDLRKKLKIPHTLSEVVDEKTIDLNKISKMALDDPSTSGNPKKLNLSDLEKLYRNSLKGEL